MQRRAFLGLPALLRLLRADDAPPQPPHLKLAPQLAPGHDEFPEEQTAMQQETALLRAVSTGEFSLDVGCEGRSPAGTAWKQVGAGVWEAEFGTSDVAAGLRAWLDSFGEIRRAQFFVLPGEVVRYEFSSRRAGKLIHCVGHWKARWREGRLSYLAPLDETRATAGEPMFRDVTGAVLEKCPAFHEQLSRGIPYWRARLDPATGIDIYGNNGIAVGDIDNDGADELFVCQPGGLPNRLFKFRDGHFDDVTDTWGLALLDDTSSALFLDLRNSGHQDLVVLRSSGPLLYLNEGTTFRLRDGAFRFETRPQGGFTGMAAADYDRDGKLDLYLCTYVYFQTEAQYTYPVPYHDARNGPPNFLFHNGLKPDGSGYFDDVTAATGMDQNNNRFSFAPSWCDSNGNGWPDLYVANDFGRNNYYVNENGRFHDTAAAAKVEDPGPGMSVSWFDYDGDGRPDLYVSNMWSASGQRVASSPKFAPMQGPGMAEAWRHHIKGNSLYRNRGDGTFEETSDAEGVAMGRWAWSSGGHDLDNDGTPEILVTCGMLTNTSHEDAMSFFWRQVVARSPSSGYEDGWNAINQFIREDISWSGREPNVCYKKHGRRFYDVSGISGLDFADDSRAFAIADFDGDGCPDILLKSRLGPQVRVLQNNCAAGHYAVAFALRGTKSNRDAIGAKIEVDGRAVWLDGGNGYLSQHSKRVLVGLGPARVAEKVRITWPSGLVQTLPQLAAGHTYVVTEGKAQIASRPFNPHRPLPERPFPVDNQPRRHTTWFVTPVLLPERRKGPGVLTLKESRPVWEVFRRYLFDWRTRLELPFTLLLDSEGRAVKVYARAPDAAEVRADLALLARGAPSGLPFKGTCHKPPRRDYFKFGAAMLWAGCYEEALPYLDEVLRQSPSNARVLLLAGQIHLRAHRDNRAEEYLRRAIAVNPAYADAWSEMGGVYEARHDTPQALACYERALSFKPDLPYVLLNAAQTADKASNPGKAEQYYRRALTADPNSADAANGLGLVMAKKGRWEEARKLFLQAISLRRDYASAINNLGVLYLETGQVDDAIAAFDYGIRMAPDEDVLYLNLGRIYARKGLTDKAREVMRSLIARKPGNETAQRALRELEGRP